MMAPWSWPSSISSCCPGALSICRCMQAIFVGGPPWSDLICVYMLCGSVFVFCSDFHWSESFCFMIACVVHFGKSSRSVLCLCIYVVFVYFKYAPFIHLCFRVANHHDRLVVVRSAS
jgi:hypothetical protein